ncbi:YifB family Mg chelatase-like AAA ATPase [soil metagenome]
MLAKVCAGTTIGLHGVLVEVEADVAGRGFPTFTIVGLPNKAVDEAKDRVRTAITNAGYEMPDSRITVNLAPADVPKSGSSFDLAIALGVLAANGFISQDKLNNAMFVGELSLEGNVRKVTGIIPLLLLAKEQNINTIFIPAANISEAALISDLTIYPVESLPELLAHLENKKLLKSFEGTMLEEEEESIDPSYDFAQVQGQEYAKRAMEIAAAGFHNIHLKGSPGAGKTLLSRSFPTILPRMDKDEILEVAKIYSVIGDLKKSIFHGLRPFRAPHHTTSRTGLIGGGSMPVPGEISLAHRGVLFLDEFPEFPRTVLESMRQPIEDGIVTISRAAGSLTYPSRFLLLAASNPCPCGFFGHPSRPCVCATGIVTRYQKRLSGPLLDRIDIHIDVPPVEIEKLAGFVVSEPSKQIRERVAQARELQQKRFINTRLQFNSEMSSSDVRKFCSIHDDAQKLLKQAVEKLSLSARSYFKIIKVSQTIADLSGQDEISTIHIAEALQYRQN